MVDNSVIALIGYTGVGKTTVARHLEINHGFKRVMLKDFYFADTWGNFIALKVREGLSVIIEDCIFKSEVSIVENLGGKVWRILRISAYKPHHYDLDHLRTSQTIKNYGTIGELKTCVDKLLEK